MNHSNFSALPARTQSSLARISDAVEGVLPVEVRSWRIDVSALPPGPDEPAVIQEVSAWADKSKACLYYFECHSPNLDLGRVERAFADAKTHGVNDRAYPRLNAQEGGCFYVGSSRSIATRLREHFGYGPKQTYALQLIHWARPLSLELELVCAKYEENTPAEVIEALEDTLWETKRPMFGRRGRR